MESKEEKSAGHLIWHEIKIFVVTVDTTGSACHLAKDMPDDLTIDMLNEVLVARTRIPCCHLMTFRVNENSHFVSNSNVPPILLLTPLLVP